MKKILYLVILLVFCVLLLRFGGYDIDSFKSAIHLRDPSTVLSPITDNIPKGQEIIGGNGGNGGGYEFDPNLKLDGSSGGSNPSNNNQDSTVIPNSSDNTNNSNNNDSNSEINSEPNSEIITESNSNSESESNTEDSKEDTTNDDSDTDKSENKSESKPESTTEKKQNISNKIYKFIVDGKETILTSETAASFAQWLEQNFKEDSDISYSTDDKESKDNNTTPNESNYTFEDGKNLDELVSSISTIKSLPDYDDYDRNTFEKPVIKYNLNGKKVNRNDYAWKTSPYFNEADFTYTCPYTGKVFKDLDDKKADKDFSILDFDHIVPLKSAYLRGAKDWTLEQQNAYAYDQSIGVDVYNSANRSKSDKGPAEWLPDVNKGSYCYSWLVICSKYNLSMTEEEIKICNDEINKAIKNGEKIEFMGGSYNG